jgi:hypothetical protein
VELRERRTDKRKRGNRRSVRSEAKLWLDDDEASAVAKHSDGPENERNEGDLQREHAGGALREVE